MPKTSEKSEQVVKQTQVRTHTSAQSKDTQAFENEDTDSVPDVLADFKHWSKMPF